MAGCETCFFGGKKVGFKGNIESPLVIVGESPGPMELAKNKPFIGPAGELLHSVLDPLLKGTGIEPFITNALNCLPRQKDPAKLGQATRCCQSRLEAEIRLHPRKVILALGNAALWSTTGNYNLKITQVRGQVYASGLASEGIIAAVHPAFLLRGGGNLQQWRRDFQHAISLLGVEQASHNKMAALGKFIPTPYVVLHTPAEVKLLAAKLKTAKIVGADIETDGFNPRTSTTRSPAEYEGSKIVVAEGIRCKGEGILSIGICFNKEMTYVIPGKLITKELFRNKAKWVWQNGKYDISWLRHFGFTAARVDDDTMLMSYLLNEQGGSHDLEQIGSDWLQAPNYKDMLDEHIPTTKHSYAYIPKDVLYKYQALDTALTFQLREPIRSRVMADKHLKKVYEKIMIPASEFIMQVETNGFATDLEEVAKNEIRLLEVANGFEKKFGEIATGRGHPDINIRSPKQVAALLYGTMKMGNIDASTDADALERLVQKYPDDTTEYLMARTLLNYRKVHKLLSTYVIPTREKTDPTDGRIHTTFKLHGTTTGRLSSNKPNMQNVPRDPKIRGMFVAPKGRCLLEVDLAQAELRVLACLSGDKKMIDIFNSGISLHDEVAEYLFGKGFNKEQKMIAKNVNFGIVYGITPYGLKDQIEINAHIQGSAIHVDKAEAREWIDGWYARFPEAASLIHRFRMAPAKGQTLISAFGRKRRFGVVSQEKINNLMNEAANFPEQSAAHDITLLTGIKLEPKLRKDWGVLVVNEVHDCLVNEIEDDLGVIIPVAKLLIETMESIPKAWGLKGVPFKAEAEIGQRWGNLTKFDPYKYEAEKLGGVNYGEVIKAKAA